MFGRLLPWRLVTVNSRHHLILNGVGPTDGVIILNVDFFQRQFQQSHKVCAPIDRYFALCGLRRWEMGEVERFLDKCRLSNTLCTNYRNVDFGEGLGDLLSILAVIPYNR